MLKWIYINYIFLFFFSSDWKYIYLFALLDLRYKTKFGMKASFSQYLSGSATNPGAIFQAPYGATWSGHWLVLAAVLPQVIFTRYSVPPSSSNSSFLTIEGKQWVKTILQNLCGQWKAHFANNHRFQIPVSRVFLLFGTWTFLSMWVFLQIIFIYGRNAYFRAKLRGFKQFVRSYRWTLLDLGAQNTSF